MAYIEETITASDGLRLFLRRREIADPKAEIVITHGFGEHSGRYDALAEHLASHNFSVTVYDHRGHGLSDGLPGHVDSFSEYDEDLGKVISLARERVEPKPLFLIGHSMGGLLALRYAARKGDQLCGLVVSAPLIAVAIAVPAHKLMIARVGARFSPRFRLDNEINPAYLSRDPDVGRAYAADPLVNRKISTKWFTEATKAMQEAADWAPNIKIPLLAIHGTEDRLASVEATKRLFAGVGSADKELVIYPGYYHELFNEPEKQEIFEKVTGWLEERCGRR